LSSSVVLDYPIIAGIVVHNAFVYGRLEALDGEVLQCDVIGFASECVTIYARTVQDRTGCADVAVTALRCDLPIFVPDEPMRARSQPETVPGGFASVFAERSPTTAESTRTAPDGGVAGPSGTWLQRPSPPTASVDAPGLDTLEGSEADASGVAGPDDAREDASGGDWPVDPEEHPVTSRMRPASNASTPQVNGRVSIAGGIKLLIQITAVVGRWFWWS
jgi:hypothetical protein